MVRSNIFRQNENSIFNFALRFVTAPELLKDASLVVGDFSPVLRRVLTAGDVPVEFFGPLEQLAVKLSLLATLDLVSEGAALTGMSLGSVATKSSVVLHHLAADAASDRALRVLVGVVVLGLLCVLLGCLRSLAR